MSKQPSYNYPLIYSEAAIKWGTTESKVQQMHQDGKINITFLEFSNEGEIYEVVDTTGTFNPGGLEIIILYED